jgi:myo-inositol 2-dehydrogenase/D-chiro-inositol 1-dehydrogenase
VSPSLRIVVIGAGRMGADHVDRLTRRIVGAKVAAVVDIELARARRAAQADLSIVTASSLEEVLNSTEVDAAVLATPGVLHKDALLELLGRGLPVLCEKPLTPDAESAWSVLEAEQGLGVRRIQVGFMRRFDPEYQRLRGWFVSGALGAPLMLHFVHRNAESPPGFTNEMLINDSVVHEFDAIRFLTGEEIRSVLVRRGRITRHAPAGQHDPQHVLIETESGILADVEIFSNAQLGYQVAAQAVFEDGVVVTGEEQGLRVSSAGRWGGEVPRGFIERFRSVYDAELQSWVNAVRGDQPVGPTAWDGYAAAACCEAGVAAQKSDEKIPVHLKAKPSLYSTLS